MKRTVKEPAKSGKIPKRIVKHAVLLVKARRTDVSEKSISDIAEKNA